MKARPSNIVTKAFTVFELLIVIGIIVVLFALIVPTKDRATRGTIVSCMSNQRQIAIGQTIWANDHNGLYSWRVAAAEGGTMELAASGNPTPHFQVLSNYSPFLKHLLCPSEPARHVATNFAELDESNLSYFLSVDAMRTNMPFILTGDRHLKVNGQSVKPGLLVFSSNATVGWTRELHAKSAQVPLGILAFTDGHAEAAKEKLPLHFQRQNLAANHLVIP